MIHTEQSTGMLHKGRECEKREQRRGRERCWIVALINTILGYSWDVFQNRFGAGEQLALQNFSGQHLLHKV